MKIRKLGIFYVSDGFFHDLKPGDGVNLFKDMVVFEAFRDFMKGKTKYIAMHPSFDDVDQACMAPEYQALFSNDSPYPTWVKL